MYKKYILFRKLEYASGNWKNLESFEPGKRLRTKSFLRLKLGLFKKF